MKDTKIQKNNSEDRSQKNKEKEYIAPTMISFSGDDVLEEVGPAKSCGNFAGSVIGC